MKALRFCLLSAALGLNASAQWSFEGITRGSDPSPSYSTNIVGPISQETTWGWTFTANSSLSVDSLGVFERILRHRQSSFVVRVGLWTSRSNLVAAANVTPLSPITGQSRYQTIAPVTLTAGETYHLGASTGTSISDAEFVSGPGVSPYIGFGGIASSTSNFSFPPSWPNGAGTAILFPNFIYSVPVPNPFGPQLHIAALADNRITLFWPASATNYVPEMVTNLTSANWTTVTNDSTAVTNGEQTVGVMLTNVPSGTFFRLHAQ